MARSHSARPDRRAPWRTLGAWALVFGAPSTAFAQPAVEWSAPRGCPSSADLTREIETLQGPPRAGNSALRVVATVARIPRGRWQVRIETVTRDGTVARTVEARTCRQAMEAAAVVIAIAFDEEPPREEPPTPREPPPPTAPRRIARVTDDSVRYGGATRYELPRRRSPISIALRVGLARDTDGAAMYGASASTLWRRGLLRVEGRMSWWRGVDEAAAGNRTSIDLVLGSVRACLGARWSVIELRPCAGAEFGRAGFNRGEGVEARRVRVNHAALLASAAALVHVTDALALGVAAEGAYRLTDGWAGVFGTGEAARASLRFDFGAEVALP